MRHNKIGQLAIIIGLISITTAGCSVLLSTATPVPPPATPFPAATTFPTASPPPSAPLPTTAAPAPTATARPPTNLPATGTASATGTFPPTALLRPTAIITSVATLAPALTTTSTPVPPTITPSPIPPIKHPIPGTPPQGTPSNTSSEYLKTVNGGFAIISESATQLINPEAIYYITVEFLNPLPAGAYLEAHFEDPRDSSLAVLSGARETSPTQVTFRSLEVKGLKCRNYWSDVHIYTDDSKTKELAAHVQWIQATFDLDLAKAIEDITNHVGC